MTTTTPRPAIPPTVTSGRSLGGADHRQANGQPMPAVVALAGASSRPPDLVALPETHPAGGTKRRRAAASAMPNRDAPAAADRRQAKDDPMPGVPAPAGTDPRAASCTPMPDLDALGGTKVGSKPGVIASRPAGDGATTIEGALGGGGSVESRSIIDAQCSHALDGGPGRPAIGPSMPMSDPLVDPALEMAAAVLDDLERVKNANANRLRQLTRSVEDSDGQMRGFGLDESHPDVAQLAGMVEALTKLEHDATLNLQRALRKHPLHPWVRSIRGIGEKQAARLLAVIGDPYIRPALVRADGTELPEGPRTVSALWAYCGLHVLPGHEDADTQPRIAGEGGDAGQGARDTQTVTVGVAPKRRRGERANWSTIAKTRAYLIAESCLKQLDANCRTGQRSRDDQSCFAGAVDGRASQVGNEAQGSVVGPAVQHPDNCRCSPYRRVYDRRRAHTALTHSDWTDGHAHADAMRVASKAILRDLWRAARDIHEGAA